MPATPDGGWGVILKIQSLSMAVIERLEKGLVRLEIYGLGLQLGPGVLIHIARCPTPSLEITPAIHLSACEDSINPLPHKESRKTHNYNNDYISNHLRPFRPTKPHFYKFRK